MMVWLIGIVFGFIALWAGYTYFYEGNLGQPAYVVVERSERIEQRRYSPFIIASIQTTSSGEAGLSAGFRILAGYIFGGNKRSESLAMTAPVLQQNEPGETLPMTAPVLQTQSSMRMAFVMPSDRSIEQLPIPNDARVSLSSVDWGDAVAIRFSGRGKQERFKRAEQDLRAYLRDQGFSPAGQALYAQYNSPSAFPPLRRNEVIIPISAPE